MRVPFPVVLRLEALAWAVLLLLFAGFAAHVLAIVVRPFAAHHYFINDFFAQWSFARFAWEGYADDIYDAAILHPFQLSLAPALREDFPYPYPPSFLLYILPLGALPFMLAYGAWMGGTLALYLAAAWPRGGGWLPRALVLLAPAVPSNISFGQNGFLTAAFLLGGFRLLPARPVLAGIAFGLLSFKPQFGLLVPVALVAAGQWRCVLAATATVAGLAFASIMAFDWSLWPEWFSYLPVHAGYVDSLVSGTTKTTLQGALLLAGADLRLARAVPMVILGCAIPIVWVAFRQDRRLAPAILVAASFAAAPYAFIYDLPALAGPAIAALTARPASGVRLLDDAVIALALSVPAVMTLAGRFYWIGGAACLLLFGLVTLRSRAAG